MSHIENILDTRKEKVFLKRYSLTVDEAIRTARGCLENNRILFTWLPLPEGGAQFAIIRDEIVVDYIEISPYSREGFLTSIGGHVPSHFTELSDEQRKYASWVDDEVMLALDLKGAGVEELKAMEASLVSIPKAKRNKGGRPVDNDYDEAAEKIERGELSFEEARQWLFYSRNMTKPNKTDRQAFKRAMDRRKVVRQS